MHTSTFYCKVIVNVDKLIKLTIGRKTFTRTLIELDAENLDRRKITGFSHKRYKNTDISIPILITHDNQIIDGRHRLCKLFDMGMKTVKVRIVTDEELFKCEIK